MEKVKQIISHNIILVLAVIFVTYHVVSTVLGIVSFSRLLFWTDEEVIVESSQENVASSTSTDEGAGAVVYGYNVEKSQWPNRIVISPAQINIAIVGQPRGQNVWSTSKVYATFDVNSAQPNGQAGNTIIFGASDNGPFQSLEQLSVHDEILLETQKANYTYAVTGFNTIGPDSASAYAQSPDPILTLIAAPSMLSNQKLLITASLTREVKK